MPQSSRTGNDQAVVPALPANTGGKVLRPGNDATTVDRYSTGYAAGYAAGLAGGGGTMTYRMRAKDGTLGRLVYWQASGTIDSTGAGYTGPGPLTDIVVQMTIGKA